MNKGEGKAIGRREGESKMRKWMKEGIKFITANSVRRGVEKEENGNDGRGNGTRISNSVWTENLTPSLKVLTNTIVHHFRICSPR